MNLINKYQLTAFLAFSVRLFVLVSATDEKYIEKLEQSIKLSEEVKNDLEALKNVVFEGTDGDRFGTIKEEVLVRAIPTYLVAKRGLYSNEITRAQYLADFKTLIVKPCEALDKAWTLSLAVYLMKTWSQEMIQIVKSHPELNNMLEDANVCNSLWRSQESLGSKSFQYMKSHQKKSQLQQGLSFFGKLFKPREKFDKPPT